MDFRQYLGLLNTATTQNPLARGLLGIGDAAASIGSGILAQPIAGLAGILATPGGPEKAANAVRTVQNRLTYQPRTEEARNALNTLGTLTEPLNKLKEYTGEVGYQVGGPVGGMLGATLPDAAMMAAPLAMRKPTPQPFPLPMQSQAGALIPYNPMVPAKVGSAGLATKAQSIVSKDDLLKIRQLRDFEMSGFEAAQAGNPKIPPPANIAPQELRDAWIRGWERSGMAHENGGATFSPSTAVTKQKKAKWNIVDENGRVIEGGFKSARDADEFADAEVGIPFHVRPAGVKGAPEFLFDPNAPTQGMLPK